MIPPGPWITHRDRSDRVFVCAKPAGDGRERGSAPYEVLAEITSDEIIRSLILANHLALMPEMVAMLKRVKSYWDYGEEGDDPDIRKDLIGLVAKTNVGMEDQS